MRFAMMMTIGVLVGSAHAQPGWVLGHQKISETAPASPPFGPRPAFGEFLDLRVDGDNGSPTGDGSGWGLDAYKYLQDALADAADAPPGATVRLLVAATNPSNPYRPDRDAANPNGTEDRDSTFLLNFSNVQLLGGFPPGGGDLADRDPALHGTVLSGLLRSPCGAPIAGNCFQPNGTPGCDDAECCEAVCTVDPDCCQVAWDQACADLAFAVCGSCGDQGSGRCFEANGTPGCEDAACCEFVCAARPECCNDQWDQACANFANLVCGVCGEPDSGSCFEPNGTPGCEDLDCCAVVCELDPLCCIQPWSQSCADIAIQLCDPPLKAGDPPKAYHVVTADGVDDSTRIDGFTITNGLADEATGNNGLGAGMLILNASPAVVRVTFTENSAPGHGGGAMHIGGASHPIVVNTSFIQNTGREAGALHTEDGIAGGTFVNCLFSGNASQVQGGAVNPGGGSLTFFNCTLADNSVDIAKGGGAIFNEGGASFVNLTNCILWGNLAGGIPSQINGQVGGVTVSYSDIHGGWGDPMDMNIDADPLFVDPDDGDYHLSPGSPCIDAANNAAVLKGFDTDLDGNLRLIDDPNTPDTGLGDCPIVDMGSYEFQEGTSDCCPGDIDNSGDVGVKDLLFLLGTWGPCPKQGDCPADFDDSGDVGVKDLLILLGNWGPCP